MSMELLQQKICEKKTPALVAFDLTPELLPPTVWSGGDGAALAAAYEQWGGAVLEALADAVPAVKFHPVYFERLGSRGLDVLRTLCAKARGLGYYVLLETDRCEQSAVAELTARMYFGPLTPSRESWEEPWPVDGLYIGGYTGSDGVKPYLSYCKALNKSLFVMGRTANKSAREVQDLISGDRVVHGAVADLAIRWSVGMEDGSGFSRVGVTVSPRSDEEAAELRRRYERLFFLICGRTIQSSSLKHITKAFNKYGRGAVVEITDGVLNAWQKAGEGKDPLEAVRQAGKKLREELGRHVMVM